jgi:hypothetical protein
LTLSQFGEEFKNVIPNVMGKSKSKPIMMGGGGFNRNTFGHQALTPIYIPTYPMKNGMVVSEDDFEFAMSK